MKCSIVNSTLPIVCKSSGPSFSTKPHLLNSKKQIHQKLVKKLELAMDKCNPMYSVKDANSKDCIVLWSEIEELSSKVNDINIELKLLDTEYECWDDMECREYDV